MMLVADASHQRLATETYQLIDKLLSSRMLWSFISLPLPLPLVSDSLVLSCWTEWPHSLWQLLVLLCIHKYYISQGPRQYSTNVL